MDNEIKKCASCFVFNKHNQILLIHHKKFNKYIQPGGKVEGEEKEWETAIREVFQETNIKIEIPVKEPFNIEVYNTKIGRQEDHQFVGIPLNNEISNNEESYSSGWYDIDNLPDNIIDDLREKIEMILKRNYGRKYSNKL